MKMKIGDIEITTLDYNGTTEYVFTVVIMQTTQAMGIYKTIEEGISSVLKSKLRKKDQASLEQLRGLFKEKNGNLKEVRKALIDLE